MSVAEVTGIYICNELHNVFCVDIFLKNGCIGSILFTGKLRIWTVSFGLRYHIMRIMSFFFLVLFFHKKTVTVCFLRCCCPCNLGMSQATNFWTDIFYIETIFSTYETVCFFLLLHGHIPKIEFLWPKNPCMMYPRFYIYSRHQDQHQTRPKKLS